jgi:hypothetical protein
VFAINFGEIGFLATVEHRTRAGIARALGGDFGCCLPGIVVEPTASRAPRSTSPSTG